MIRLLLYFSLHQSQLFNQLNVLLAQMYQFRAGSEVLVGKVLPKPTREGGIISPWEASKTTKL